MALILSYFRQYFQFFLLTRKKTQNIQQHISHLHIHTSYFAQPIDFFPYEPILQKYEFILFGFSLAWLRVFWFLIAPL